MSDHAAAMLRAFVDLARDFNRRGDVALRNQAEEDIRCVSPNLAYAEKVIAEMYGEEVTVIGTDGTPWTVEDILRREG